MSETKKRNVHLPEFKAKVGLEAVRGMMTINEIGQAHGVHPVQVSQWKKGNPGAGQDLVRGQTRAPDGGRPQRPGSAVQRNRAPQDGARLAQKKVRDQPAMMRQTWIDKGDTVALTWQCALAGVSRATVYARQKPKLITEDDEMLKRLIDEEYTRHPFYGSRKMVVYLGRCGHTVNRKRAQRLMRTLGLQGMAPGPNTSRAHPQHKVHPYLLRGVAIERPNQVWSTDITYIRLARGFAYLVAIIDWYSRKVLSWRISNSMEAVFCVDCLEDALRIHGTPEVFNSDQGSQFTSDAFTGVLKRESVTISMDGRGRAFDNIFVERLWRSVKHEDVYLNGYSAMGDLLVGLSKYFVFYNGERPHQALKNQTPDVVHKTASGGGAMILDKYGPVGNLPIALRSTGTAQDEVLLKDSTIPNTKNRGSAVQLCVKSSAT